MSFLKLSLKRNSLNQQKKNSNDLLSFFNLPYRYRYILIIETRVLTYLFKEGYGNRIYHKIIGVLFIAQLFT